jgi:hypothetical protein
VRAGGDDDAMLQSALEFAKWIKVPVKMLMEARNAFRVSEVARERAARERERRVQLGLLKPRGTSPPPAIGAGGMAGCSYSTGAQGAAAAAGGAGAAPLMSGSAADASERGAESATQRGTRRKSAAAKRDRKPEARPHDGSRDGVAPGGAPAAAPPPPPPPPPLNLVAASESKGERSQRNGQKGSARTSSQRSKRPSKTSPRSGGASEREASLRTASSRGTAAQRHDEAPQDRRLEPIREGEG